MWKLFKHLGEHKAAVLLIILLLVGQAYCDLALPSYTSDIVDVGIQQGGIENAVPERMREETFDSLSLFMTEDEKNEALQAYDLKDGIYERNTYGNTQFHSGVRADGHGRPEGNDGGKGN